MTIKYLTAPGAFGSGPNMSIPHMTKGQRELKLWRLSGGVRGMSANSWHRLHLFVKSKVSALSVGH